MKKVAVIFFLFSVGLSFSQDSVLIPTKKIRIRQITMGCYEVKNGGLIKSQQMFDTTITKSSDARYILKKCDTCLATKIDFKKNDLILFTEHFGSPQKYNSYLYEIKSKKKYVYIIRTNESKIKYPIYAYNYFQELTNKLKKNYTFEKIIMEEK